MAKNENSNFSYMTRRIGGTTYKVKVSAALRRIMCVCGTVCRTWQPVILWKTA